MNPSILSDKTRAILISISGAIAFFALSHRETMSNDDIYLSGSIAAILFVFGASHYIVDSLSGMRRAFVMGLTKIRSLFGGLLQIGNTLSSGAE